MALRVWVTRHGDRTDYEMGIPAWQEIANPNRVKDPPLSALGRQQAIEMGKEAAKNAREYIAFTSLFPYDRFLSLIKSNDHRKYR